MSPTERRRARAARVAAAKAAGTYTPSLAGLQSHFRHDELGDAIVADRRRGRTRIVVGTVSLDKLLTKERKPSARSIHLSDPLAETDDRHRIRALRPRERKSVQKSLSRFNAVP